MQYRHPQGSVDTLSITEIYKQNTHATHGYCLGPLFAEDYNYKNTDTSPETSMRFLIGRSFMANTL